MLSEETEGTVCGVRRDNIFKKRGKCMRLGERMGERNAVFKVLLTGS